MMSETCLPIDFILRLRNYRTYGSNGKNWAEIRAADKDEVIVAVVVGHEPKLIEKGEQCFDVDSAIVRLAEAIKRRRKQNLKAN